MANAISKTDIINLALSNIGQDVIADVSEKSEVARKANLYYDVVRRTLLREHDWSFALRWATLAASTEKSPYPSCPYVFARPSDCLFLKKVGFEGAAEKNFKFFIFVSQKNAQLVACPFDKVQALYVKDEEDVTLFDPAFVACFALLLAAELAVPVAGDSKLAAFMYQKYQAKLQDARIANKVEQFEHPEQTSVFEEAR